MCNFICSDPQPFWQQGRRSFMEDGVRGEGVEMELRCALLARPLWLDEGETEGGARA